jgi:hypothetical protein
LAAEFALAQWLVRGIAADDEEMAAEAEAMLQELEADVEEHGGQVISAAPTGSSAGRAAVEPVVEPVVEPAVESGVEPMVEAAAPPQDGAAASIDVPADDDDTGEGADHDDAVIMDDARSPEQDGADEEPGAVQPVTLGAEADGSEDELVPDELTADEAESRHPSEAEDPEDAEDHAAAPHHEGPPTTALNLDEVRQLDIRRTTNPS